MSNRANYYTLAPEAVQSLLSINKSLDNFSIDKKLRRLIEVRVSQINGCAYCCDLHSRQARNAGVPQQILDVLPAWRESDFLSEKEMAALEWAETITEISDYGADDELYEDLEKHFTDKEIVEITFIAVVMNSWNRLAIGFGKSPEKRLNNIPD